jgi:hypothetical protein
MLVFANQKLSGPAAHLTVFDVFNSDILRIKQDGNALPTVGARNNLFLQCPIIHRALS